MRYRASSSFCLLCAMRHGTDKGLVGSHFGARTGNWDLGTSVVPAELNLFWNLVKARAAYAYDLA